MVDELPLLSTPERRGLARPAAVASAAVAVPASGVSASSAVSAISGMPGAASTWVSSFGDRWGSLAGYLWGEVKSLVRVTRIDQPEAMLVAPEQAFFLRENLKLRLLNARLALLSRQFDTAQADLREVQSVLNRYFDRNARRVVIGTELVRQVAAQARQLNVPRPDESLAALAAAQAGR